MIAPSLLRSSIATVLRASNPVMANLDYNPLNVVDFQEKGDLFSTVSKMKPKQLMVVYTGTVPAGRREAYWAHSFSLILRPENGEPSSLFVALVDALIDVEVHPLYHSTDLPSCQRRSIPVGDSTSFDYFEVTTTFTSKGVQ